MSICAHDVSFSLFKFIIVSSSVEKQQVAVLLIHTVRTEKQKIQD